MFPENHGKIEQHRDISEKYRNIQRKKHNTYKEINREKGIEQKIEITNSILGQCSMGPKASGPKGRFLGHLLAACVELS